jgi:hypothetical protein
VLADSLPVLPYVTNTWFVGAFFAQGGSGNDIITRVTNNGSSIYNSGQVHEGMFNVIPSSPGYMKLIFDNTFSTWTTKTVTYDYTYHISVDITGTQVRAIFNSLKHDYDITYVNSPISYPNGTQRVLYPAQSLALNRANCIDGTVLFAAALENIGIEPFILITTSPGHAFLGYRQWPGSDEINFIETTMIGSATYAQARAAGESKAQAASDAENGLILDIKKARSAGFTPLLPKKRARSLR